MDNRDKNDIDELKKADLKCMLANSVEEQILQMKPSTDLITYYRKKVDDLKHGYLSLEVQLEVCKKVCESNCFAQEELIKRNDEVSQLTNAVSDLQVYLYQEREHVLKLSAENDKLRLCQLEYQKKFDTVLSFSGLPRDFITFLCIDPQQEFVVPRKELSTKMVKRRGLKDGTRKLLEEIVNDQNDVSQLKIQALLAEWEEQSELYHDELHSLLSDRDLRQKEWDAERERLQQQISNLNSLLKSVQSNVCDDTNRLIKMEKRHRAREEAWIEEKSNLLKCLEASHEAFHSVPQNSRNLKCQLSSLKKQLVEKDSTMSKYQDQIAALEQTILRLKDEIEFNKNHNKERCLKFSNQIKFFKQRCEDEKRRRLLDAEGFRNDIKFLRCRVLTLERKILSNNIPPE